ncbi:zinc finger protein 282-like isoform X2 [Ambystoma mexicanum]|uniref:zinc finger protein 282-like isoform X2 n=1 Tax=Ambystoma mexicanum TaxID=8296 RepID=UPI0037E7BFAC
MAQQYSDTAPGSFHDFTAHFSAVEWKLLHKWQTELYEAVMKEIHKTITCLGPTIATSIFALRPKAREEPPLVDHQDSKMSDSRNHFLRHDNVAPVTLFSNTDDSETCFMDQQETKNWCAPISQTEKADTSSVVSFKIKEENEPYFVDFQDSGQRESFTGDAGYPLKPWLLTPVRNPQNRHEEDFNRAHTRTRVVIEQTFGLLKARFCCISRSGGALIYGPEKVGKIITACAMLHNMCIRRNIPLPPDVELPPPGEVEGEEGVEVGHRPGRETREGRAVRKMVIEQSF